MNYGFIGRDNRSIKTAIGTILGKLFGGDDAARAENTHTFFATESSFAEVREVLDTYNPFSPTTAVVVHEIRGWCPKSKLSLPKNVIAALGESVPGATLIVIQASEPSTLYPLNTELETAAKSSRNFSLSVMDTAAGDNWLRQLLKDLLDRGFQLSNEAIGFVKENLRAESSVIKDFFEDICTVYEAPLALEPPDLAPLIRRPLPAGASELVDALLARDLHASLRSLYALEESMRDTEARGQDVYSVINNELVQNLVWLYQLRGLARSRLVGYNAHSKVFPRYMFAPHKKKHVFLREKQAAIWKFAEIEEALEAVYRFESALKGRASKETHQINMQILVTSFCSGQFYGNEKTRKAVLFP